MHGVQKGMMTNNERIEALKIIGVDVFEIPKEKMPDCEMVFLSVREGDSPGGLLYTKEALGK